MSSYNWDQKQRKRERLRKRRKWREEISQQTQPLYEPHSFLASSTDAKKKKKKETKKETAPKQEKLSVLDDFKSPEKRRDDVVAEDRKLPAKPQLTSVEGDDAWFGSRRRTFSSAAMTTPKKKKQKTTTKKESALSVWEKLNLGDDFNLCGDYKKKKDEQDEEHEPMRDSSIPSTAMVTSASPQSMSSMSCSMSSTPVKKKIKAIKEEEEESDDLLKIAQELQRQKKAKRAVAGTTTNETRKQKAASTEAAKKASSQAEASEETTMKSDFGDDVDDIERELLEHAMRREKQKRYEAIPKNPLTIEARRDALKDLEGGCEDSTTSEPPSSPIAEPISVKMSKNKDLWDDPSDEGEDVTNCSTESGSIKMKRGRNRKRVSQEVGKDDETADSSTKPETATKTKRTTTTSRGRSGRGRGVAVESEDLVGDTEIEALKPYLDRPKMGKPSALKPLALPFSGGGHEVPASINRYLANYQRHGVSFMHRRIAEGQGVILGDDMGLGKTVQVIGVLAALFDKLGTGQDLLELQERKKGFDTARETYEAGREQARLQGDYAKLKKKILDMPYGETRPVLISCPASVIDNWTEELDTWGHFAFAIYRSENKSLALEQIRLRGSEIMLCSHDVFRDDNNIAELTTVPWKLIIVDEAHKFKNPKTKGYVGLQRVRDFLNCPILSMTGTAFQNKHVELWAVVDMAVPGYFDDWESFNSNYAAPILHGRRKDANERALERATEATRQLEELLKVIYLKRLKADVLSNSLPTKLERVLFCELTTIQKQIYQHILTLPDYLLLRHAQGPCECGVNRHIFQQYKRLTSDRERLEFMRRKKNEITPRRNCCWKTPQNPRYGFDGDMEPHDPAAVLWRWQHPDGEACDRCPGCVLFPALHKLYKVASHASLLQVTKKPEDCKEGSKVWEEASKEYAFAQVALPKDIVRQLPGKSYVRFDGIMNDHLKLSGKMKVLAELLVEFEKRNSRVLVFSFSTRTLDMIQNYVKSRGYSHLRLDGSTPNKQRQNLVHKFQKDRSCFLFLLSTKAGGLGLNLTAANVVIIFDVDYNPTNDEQAQDRAFRIGQKRDVLVIRLVSRGTIEEIKYIRQIYKVHLKQETLGEADGGEHKKASRIFRGVQGDKDRKGELFGIENLLKYKDGSFMDEIWTSKAASKEPTSGGLDRFGMRQTTDIANAMDGLTEDDVYETIGGSNDYLFTEAMERADKRDAEKREGVSELSERPDQTKNINKTKSRGAHNEPPSVAVKLESDGLVSYLNDKGGINHDDFLEEARGRALVEEGDDGFDEEMGGQSQVIHDIFDQADVSDDEEGGNEPADDMIQEDDPYPSPVVSKPPAPQAIDSLGHSRQPAIDTAAPSPVRSKALSPTRKGARKGTSWIAASRSSPSRVQQPSLATKSARKMPGEIAARLPVASPVKSSTPFGTARSPFERSPLLAVNKSTSSSRADADCKKRPEKATKPAAQGCRLDFTETTEGPPASLEMAAGSGAAATRASDGASSRQERRAEASTAKLHDGRRVAGEQPPTRARGKESQPDLLDEPILLPPKAKKKKKSSTRAVLNGLDLPSYAKKKNNKKGGRSMKKG